MLGYFTVALATVMEGVRLPYILPSITIANFASPKFANVGGITRR